MTALAAALPPKAQEFANRHAMYVAWDDDGTCKAFLTRPSQDFGTWDSDDGECLILGNLCQVVAGYPERRLDGFEKALVVPSGDGVQVGRAHKVRQQALMMAKELCLRTHMYGSWEYDGTFRLHLHRPREGCSGWRTSVAWCMDVPQLDMQGPVESFMNVLVGPEGKDVVGIGLDKPPHGKKKQGAKESAPGKDILHEEAI